MILHKERAANQNKQAFKGDEKTSKSNAEKRGSKTSAQRNKKKDEKMKSNADKDQE